MLLKGDSMYKFAQDARRPAPISGAGDVLWQLKHARETSGRRRKADACRNMQCRASSSGPDWDKEMSLFKKRVMKPNQLETLRKIEQQVEIGKVLHSADGMVVIDGLNNDAPVGTLLSFVSGATGVLLWRQTDNLCYGLVLGSRQSVGVGEGVECKVKAILQVLDEMKGPTTKRDYMQATVPVGNALVGKITDFLGRQPGTDTPLGTDVQIPLLNAQLDMNAREQIHEPLMTGVKAVDCLTPLGRGQVELLTGPHGSGKTTVAVDAILGQKRAGVRCVYAAIGHTQQELETVVGRLQRGGAMAYTSVLWAGPEAGLGERFATACAACSRAEAVRSRGGHALVVLDDISCMPKLWEALSAQAMRLDPRLAEAGGRSEPADAALGQEQLVEYEGMLLTAQEAQRRRFFSSLIQRAAKANRKQGGGSSTMLLLLPGRPAAGEGAAVVAAKAATTSYQHLAPELREKLMAALQARGQAAGQEAGPAGLPTEVIEEFMSITDGQIVMQRRGGEAGSGPASFVVDPQASCSRIGGRALCPAMEALAPSLRFQLAQAVDAQRYAADPQDPALQRALRRAQQLTCALCQPPGQPVPLEQQVVQLFALQNGFFDDVEPEDIASELEGAFLKLRRRQPQLLAEIAATKQLSLAGEAALRDALLELRSQPVVR